MASSSSSHSISNSTPRSCMYDVFLSFRGDDTRNNFVSHLYAALEQRSLYTYKDDVTLERGETIGRSLFEAIKQSRVAVVVFSANYADSSWCLDELTCIIECMDAQGQIVIPVFYQIDPSDVRKLEMKYGEAFAKHELNHDRDIVESWKKALVTASNLSGWVTTNTSTGDGASIIKQIVATISSMSPQITNDNEDLVGIEPRLQDLKSKLEIASSGVHMVGIWGVGGGGKTTLAFSAYKEISQQFEAQCFLENIRDESIKYGLKSLQEKLLSDLLNNKTVPRNVREGVTMIKNRLCCKRVLVVLDDVDNVEQLNALAGSKDWFGQGSRIIITTRDKHLLSLKEITIYEVSLLLDDEAMKLFHKHAYRKDEPVEDYEMLSQQVVSYARGLPLALEILGSFLYSKDKEEWESALKKLKLIPEIGVTERLKISYDGLEDAQKELFLDIACFFRRWNKNEAMVVLDACSFYPVIGVKVLEQKSLVKVSNGKLDMHDLVEEMAHYIVKGKDPIYAQKHSRIWEKKHIEEFCAMRDEMLTENIRNEVLVLPRDTRDHPRLPYIVAKMKKLRLINWEGYPYTSFLETFQPIKLGCLMLKSGKQEQLWKGCKELPNLKLIDLSYSKHLKCTPDFTGLPCLEDLILENCESLVNIHPSIGYHERLVIVNMKGCLELKAFPPIIRMKRLVELKLSYCYSLQKFPDIRTKMDSLVQLSLDYTNIDMIPASLGQFCTNLIYLNLTSCDKLKRIEGNFHLLKRLRYLYLIRCLELEKLAWDLFDDKCCLEVLSLHIKSRDSLSPKLPHFPRYLRELNLSDSYLRDEDIPSDIFRGLFNLQVLDLSLSIFSRLPSNCLSRIPGLKFLNLTKCRSLVELPDLPSSIAILDASYCASLQRVGDLSSHKWLWKVLLPGCNKLIRCERLLHSILEVNVVEDRFMSVALPVGASETKTNTTRLITMQLPDNWYGDFSGFLFCADTYLSKSLSTIYIKRDRSTNMEPDHNRWEEYDKSDPEYFQQGGYVRYVPFASLKHITWWNSADHTNMITFQIQPRCIFKVVLVPRKTEAAYESRERALDCSEFWDKEIRDRKSVEILDYSESSTIQIVWTHN